MRMLDTKGNRKRRLFRVGVALLLLCIVLSIASAENNSSKADVIDRSVNISTTTPLIPIDAWIAIITIIAIIVVFGGLVYIGYLAKERGRLDMGEMRRAIAGTFVMGFTIIVFLCIIYDISRTEVIIAYIELVGIVIGFYFGAKQLSKNGLRLLSRLVLNMQDSLTQIKLVLP